MKFLAANLKFQQGVNFLKIMMDVLIEDLPNSDEDDNVYEILVRKNTKIQNRKRSINDTLLEQSVNGFRNNLKKESEEFGELCFIKKEHQEIVREAIILALHLFVFIYLGTDSFSELGLA